MTRYDLMTEVATSRMAAMAVDCAVNGTSLADFAKNWAVAFGDFPRVTRFAELGPLPGGIIVEVGNALALVAMHGVSSRTLQPFIDGMGPEMRCLDTGGLNWAIGDALLRSTSPPIPLRFPGVALQLFAGYSLGGQVALSIASKWQRTNPREQLGSVTFGSPRPFCGMDVNVNGAVKVIRWMRAYDLVVGIPPRWFESLQAYLTLCVSADAQIAPFWQPGGGRGIATDDTWSPQIGAMIFGGVNDEALLRWVTGTGGSLSAAHAWSAYFQTIFRIVDDLRAFWLPPNKLDAGESPSDLPISIQVETALASAGVPITSPGGCIRGSTANRPQHAGNGPTVVF